MRENFRQIIQKISTNLWLKKHGIDNYTLIRDSKYGWVVDVAGGVDLSNKKLKFIPVKFNIIQGDFICRRNKLTSLEFCPLSVNGNFDCRYNKLTSLEGSPTLVGGGFYCSNNQLMTLKGSPTSVGGYFDCGFNQITSLEGSPTSVGGTFYCYANQLTTLEGAPTTVRGTFHCHDNEVLGEYQEITDFCEILNVCNIYKEQNVMTHNIQLAPISKTFKV